MLTHPKSAGDMCGWMKIADCIETGIVNLNSYVCACVCVSVFVGGWVDVYACVYNKFLAIKLVYNST